jgi:hypothetical protein
VSLYQREQLMVKRANQAGNGASSRYLTTLKGSYRSRSDALTFTVSVGLHHGFRGTAAIASVGGTNTLDDRLMSSSSTFTALPWRE